MTDVDWATLETAYGSGEDLPQVIAALRSTDAAERASACDFLHATVDHQGIGRSEATAAVIPFLIDHVADPGAPDRGQVARLLAELAVGDTCWFLHDGFHPDHQTQPDNCARAQHCSTITTKTGPASRGFPSIGRGEDYTPGHGYRELHEAVCAGAPIYARALAAPDSDDDLRASLCFLCAWCTTRAQALAPVLIDRLERDASPAVRASAALGLSHVAKFDPLARASARGALLAAWGRDPSPLEARCLALAIVRFEEHETSAPVRPVIAQWIAGGVPAVMPAQFPWFRIDSPPLLFCTLFLGTDEAERAPVIAAAIAGLPHVTHVHDAADLAVWILRLTDEPAALAALIACEAAWHFNDLRGELRDRGLPFERDELRAHLSSAG